MKQPNNVAPAVKTLAELPNPPDRPHSGIQFPAQAVKIWLDLARSAMATNPGITMDDVLWYLDFLGQMEKEAGGMIDKRMEKK